MKLKNQLKKLFSINVILKILGFALFCIYLAQMYVNYAIDFIYVFKFVSDRVLVTILRWSTIAFVGTTVVTCFFGNKLFKGITGVFAPLIGLLNLIFYKENMIAWGNASDGYAYTPWRATLFVIEQILLIVIGGIVLYRFIKAKDYKGFKYYQVPIIIVLLHLTFTYQPLLGNVFEEYGEEALDFSKSHIFYLSLNVVFIVMSFLFMRKKSIEDKNLFFAVLSCSGVFNFFYHGYGGMGDLPFHLCNTAIIMMFVAFIFKMEGVYYFTLFVNVLGALFAMLFPNTTQDAIAFGVVRFWYNHIYAFSLPLLGVILGVYKRPQLKQMFKAIFWFTLYFIVVAITNRVAAEKGINVDYFFINSHFFFEKLKMKNTSLMDSYLWEVNIGGLKVTFYYLFYIAVYSIYIGLMFAVWYIYDAFFKISDSHHDLRIKKKIIRKDQEELRKALAGHKMDEPLYKEKEKMLEISHFTKIYSGSDKPSVDDFSLTVNDGEVFGFIGHNGAGKSTTIKSIVGIQSITSGTISVQGFDVSKQPVEAKLRIGYVSDNHAVYERLTGREYINYIADLYLVSKEDREERIKKYVSMFKLEDAIDREIKSYSHGMKQKIVVIASLIHDPKVWILDEPLTGLDPTSAYQIKECMRDHANRGNIVFFSSHVIEVVERVCDRICIINHGKLMCEYKVKDLKEQNISLEDLYLKYVNYDPNLEMEK